MDVTIGMGTADHAAIEIRRVEPEYLRLAVIDPDECMKVVAHL